MTREQCLERVVTQFTKLNSTLVNGVNKGAYTMDSFKESVYAWMNSVIPVEYQDDCYELLCDTAWNYDILKPLIYDDGAISDISCHSWDNIQIMVRGKWKQCDFHFRDEEHYRRFFNHVCTMNNMVINERNATDNATDIKTCPDFRLRLNFVHKVINTYETNVFSIRKIPTHKKSLMDLTRPEEGMLTVDMVDIVRKHLKDATGILIIGMTGSGKTTFLNALIEELPEDWKYLFIQENEELYSDRLKNSDFLKTVKGINKYDVSHDLSELARNALLMSVRCVIVGETKGGEALYLMNIITSGVLGITTAHSDSSEHGLDKICDYVKYASDYTKDQCMEMLTAMNKVFFLEGYRLREISTIYGYDNDTHKLIMETEYYTEN